MEQAVHPQSSPSPSTSQDGRHPVTVKSVNWEHWLAALRALPADAAEWEGVSNFLKAVQQLSDTKRLERESTHRVRSKLMSLAAEYSDALDFFGLTDEVLEWTGVPYPPNEVSSLVDQINALQTHLAKHWGLCQRPSAPTLAEERAKRRALLELEEDVTAAYDRLSATLRTASSPRENTEKPDDSGNAKNSIPAARSAVLTPASPQLSAEKLQWKDIEGVETGPQATPAMQASADEPTIFQLVEAAPAESSVPPPPAPAPEQRTSQAKEAEPRAASESPASSAPESAQKTRSPDTRAFKLAEPATPKAPAQVSESTAEASSVEPTSQVVAVPVDSTHTPLDSAARQYNSLTKAQERQLNSIRSGIGLLFSSEALGCSHIIEAYKRFTPINLSESSTVHCQEIPFKVATSDQVEYWLEQYVKEHQPGTRLVAYRSFSSGTKEQLLEQVQAALGVCKRPDKGQPPWLSVTFIFDAKATWSWLSLPPQHRDAAENKADAIVSPSRWDPAGIRARLSHHHKLDSDEVCEQILHATGGWPYLLDVLFYRCNSQQDPRPFAQSIEKEITQNSSKLAQQFWHCLGLDNNDSSQKILQFMHQHKQVPIDLALADANEIELPLPPAAYTATVTYLRRLGCIENKDGMLTVEPIVSRVLSVA